MNIKNYSKKKELFNGETVITFTVVLVAMLLFSFFPAADLFQQVILSITFLLVVPYLYIKLVFEEKLENFGFKAPLWRDGWWLMPICFLIAGGFFYLIFKHTDFKEIYFLGDYTVTKNFFYLFLYEFLAINLFVVLYEFFFRGFLMFYLEKKIGVYAIFGQFLFFVLFMDILERGNLNYVFYYFTALMAGLIAYRSRSLVYSYFFSIIVLVTADLIYLKLAG